MSATDLAALFKILEQLQGIVSNGDITFAVRSSKELLQTFSSGASEIESS